MNIKKIHTDGYYDAKQNRAGRSVCFFLTAMLLIYFVLKDSWFLKEYMNISKPDMVIIYIEAILAVMSAVFFINYLRIRSMRKRNAELIGELKNYGIKIPCRISLIEKKGMLEEYVIHITGTDGYGISHDFRSDSFFKNPGDYISEGDELYVYADRENEDIYYIQYPDSFPSDAPRFYIY